MRTESLPLATSEPVTTSRAPVARPSSDADAASSRPDHRRMTIVGGTARRAPAPSKLRERTSTSPSCQSASAGSSTWNGATAITSGSSVFVERAVTTSAATAAARAAATPPMSRFREEDIGLTASAASASRNAPAVAKRCAGSLASAFAIAALTCAGTSFRCDVTAGGASRRCAASTACAVGPLNGGTPTSIS